MKIILALLGIFIIVVLSLFFYRQTHRPNPIIYSTHCIAHGQYINDSLPPNSMQLFRYLAEEKGYRFLELDVIFTSDDIPVLCHDWNISNIAVDKYGKPADVIVEQTTYKKLCSYNFAKHPKKDAWHQVNLFQEIVEYAKEKNLCLQVDIQKWWFSARQCKILYDIVADADMLQSVVWELSEQNLKNFIRFSPFLIYQIDGKWSKEFLDSYWWLDYWSNQLIFLYQFHKESDMQDLNFKETIEYGHKKGFLMMNAVVNDRVIADSLFNQGVDLIDTGCLFD